MGTTCYISWFSVGCKWDPSSVVRANALLKSFEVRKRRKAACIETFVKPTLLYGLSTIVVMSLTTENYPLYSIPANEWPWAAGSGEKNTVQELKVAIPTTSITTRLRSRPLKLWTSACRNSGLTKRLCSVQQRNRICQLRKDAA